MKLRRRTGFGWLELIIGIVQIILGIYALTHPGNALSGIVVVYGVIAVVVGIADVLFYVKAERYIGFGPAVSLITGILSVLAGLVLIVYPGAGTWTMAIIFPIWFIAHCISRLSGAPMVRLTAGNRRYYVVLVVNIIGLILGFLMLIRPSLSITSQGVIIGLYLLLLGVDSIVIGMSKIGENW